MGAEINCLVVVIKNIDLAYMDLSSQRTWTNTQEYIRTNSINY